MRIIDIKSGRVLYGKKGKQYKVTAKFWNALIAGKVKYRSGGTAGDIEYTTINDLKLGQHDLEKTFAGIADTIIGEAVLTGKLPPDTLL